MSDSSGPPINIAIDEDISLPMESCNVVTQDAEIRQLEESTCSITDQLSVSYFKQLPTNDNNIVLDTSAELNSFAQKIKTSCEPSIEFLSVDAEELAVHASNLDLHAENTISITSVDIGQTDPAETIRIISSKPNGKRIIDDSLGIVNGESVSISEADDEPGLEEVTITEVCGEGDDLEHVTLENGALQSNSILKQANFKKFLTTNGYQDDFEEVIGERCRVYCRICESIVSVTCLLALERHLNTVGHQAKIVQTELSDSAPPWDDEAVERLLSAMARHHHRFLNSNSPRHPIWSDILREVNTGFVNFDINQLRLKWLLLKEEYERRCCRSPEESTGENNWPEHLKIMHSFLSKNNSQSSGHQDATSSEYQQLVSDGDFTWNAECEDAFVTVLEEELPGLRSDGAQWQRMSEALEERGYCVLPEQLQRKWENLQTGYCHYEHLARKSGATVMWPLFCRIESLLQLLHDEATESEGSLMDDGEALSRQTHKRPGRGRGRGRPRGRSRWSLPRPVVTASTTSSSSQRPVRSTAGKHYKYEREDGIKYGDDDDTEFDDVKNVLELSVKTESSNVDDKNEISSTVVPDKKPFSLRDPSSIERFLEQKIEETLNRLLDSRFAALDERIASLENRILLTQEASHFATIDHETLTLEPGYATIPHVQVNSITIPPSGAVTATPLSNGLVSEGTIVQVHAINQRAVDSFPASTGLGPSVLSSESALMSSSRIHTLLPSQTGTQATLLYTQPTQLSNSDSQGVSVLPSQHLTFSLATPFTNSAVVPVVSSASPQARSIVLSGRSSAGGRQERLVLEGGNKRPLAVTRVPQQQFARKIKRFK